MKSIVGASIVSIITESLYDKPIVVFREYTQNAVDSISQVSSSVLPDALEVQIWYDENNLYFIDNGKGIAEQEFLTKMRGIANSDKSKIENIGYKGIGRLSGISYCQKLSFINILDYANNRYQRYDIDCQEYHRLRKQTDFNSLTFDALMEKIGSSTTVTDFDAIKDIAEKHSQLFSQRNTGFIVILENISPVLKNTIQGKQLIDELSWLLPVPFSDSLLNEEPFISLSSDSAIAANPLIPAKAYRVFLNGQQLERPLKEDMFRSYLCTSQLSQYGICLHAFSNHKIAVDKANPFTGIRIYLDNMLLCDETELIPALIQYGLTNHTSNELIQTVRGIGALIYIVDKISISANARRTFIDVTDADAISFLQYISEFIEKVYRTRYALSEYSSAKEKGESDAQKLLQHRNKAISALEDLASSHVELEEDTVESTDFNSMSLIEQKKIVKREITKSLNVAIKQYFAQINTFSLATCFEDFKTWLRANK